MTKPWFFKTHDQSQALTPKNPVYREWIDWCTTLQLKKDLGRGDITTDVLIKHKKKAEARIVSKENGVLAGAVETQYFLSRGLQNFKPGFGRIAVKFFRNDGDAISANETIGEFIGFENDILKVERIVLNLLGRMSGISTATNRIAGKVNRTAKNPVLVTPTRKTLWGLLDKKASAVGGGGTHRLSLDNAILIKDNHLEAHDWNIGAAIAFFFPLKTDAKFIEIEVGTVEQAIQAAEEFKHLKKLGRIKIPCFVMLDNFSAQEAHRAVKLLQKNNLRKKIGLEISGRITEKNILSYAKTGVDIISMGSLTHSAKMLDLSLELK